MNENSHPGERFPRELEILRRLTNALPQIINSTQTVHTNITTVVGLNTLDSRLRRLAARLGILSFILNLEQVNGQWVEALRTGKPYDIEYRFKRASDGAYRWFLSPQGVALSRSRWPDCELVRNRHGHWPKLVACCKGEKSQRRITRKINSSAWSPTNCARRSTPSSVGRG